MRRGVPIPTNIKVIVYQQNYDKVKNLQVKTVKPFTWTKNA